MHEASLHDESAFVTLTYDDESLPEWGSLRPSDVTKWLKRLRKSGRFRYFLCGEYGEKGRPHYHALLFGKDFSDKVPVETGKAYTEWCSDQLDASWKLGRTLLGSVTFESAAYVARYVTKKVTGSRAADRYLRVDPSTGELYRLEPEFGRMSRRKGIGRDWIEEFHSDVYPSDEVIVRGRPSKPPRYYDAYISDFDPDASEAVRKERDLKRSAGWENETRERLHVREVCTRARLDLQRRELD